MAVAGRTHKPVLNRDLCRQCGICTGACPARVAPDFRRDRDTIRGYVYLETNLAYQEDLPPCTAACPLGQDVRGYVGLLERGEAREALLAVRRDNPLPGVCAYVCHHPCESSCVRGSWDDPVSIRELKRYAVQYEAEHRDEILSLLEAQKAPSRGGKAAVIGAGPAGLSCAYALLMAGCEVEVLDALDRPGGMLVRGIPPFRLPGWVIGHDAGMIRSLGASFTMPVRVGRDVSLADLRARSDAVVAATGAWRDLEMGIPGEDARGSERCLDFLARVNMGEAVSGRVFVVGGGNAAMDAARSALRAGAGEVVVVYRRTRREMPANAEEVAAALREGVSIRFLQAPRSIVAEEGRVKGLELLRMELGAEDDSGRPRPVPVQGSEFVERADRVISAVGQRPEAPFLDRSALSYRGTIKCEESGSVSGYDGVFAAGDALSGPSTVVEAAASGKEAARQVLEFLGGMNCRA